MVKKRERHTVKVSWQSAWSLPIATWGKDSQLHCSSLRWSTVQTAGRWSSDQRSREQLSIQTQRGPSRKTYDQDLDEFFHPWVSQPKFKLKPQKTYTVRLSCATHFQSQGMWQEEYNRVLKSRSANPVVKSCNGNQRCPFSQCHCRLRSVLIFNKSTEC